MIEDNPYYYQWSLFFNTKAPLRHTLTHVEKRREFSKLDVTRRVKSGQKVAVSAASGGVSGRWLIREVLSRLMRFFEDGPVEKIVPDGQAMDGYGKCQEIASRGFLEVTASMFCVRRFLRGSSETSAHDSL